MKEELLVLRGIEEPERFMKKLVALMGENALIQTIEAIQNTDLFGPEEWRAVITLGALGGDDLDELLDEWWWKFCGSSLSRPALGAIHSGQPQKVILPSDAEGFPFAFVQNGKTPGQIPYVPMSILEYQRRIQLRIAAHADRVASTKLGAAEFVRQDIEDAMASVWASLPEGYEPRLRTMTVVSMGMWRTHRGKDDGEEGSGDGSDVSDGSR
ncbi:hypothetical protein FRC08_000327 [Ceratobasidium sp. 394]|nr:hypothetical protein FRC08_000327 [Ceratobasidium sp. 394]